MVGTVFLLFVVLFLLNVPIAFSLAGASIVAFALEGSFALYMIPQRMVSHLDSFTLTAIPFFVLSGVILAKGGVSKYLIAALKALLGHVMGGLSVVSIVSCMIFAAISGSSPATAVAIGSIVIPAMLEGGYDKRYSMGVVAAGGTLGILIPPSLALIVYGVVAEESIGKLFIAGVIPGIILGAILMITAVFIAKKKNFKKIEKASKEEVRAACKKATWGAMLPVIILGSIYSGIATPTESAAISVVYALFISIFIYKEFDVKKLGRILSDTAATTAMVYMIIAGASIFSLYLTTERIPMLAAEFISNTFTTKLSFLIAINIVFLIMGTFLEGVAITTITLPILLPVLAKLGIDPIHFAIIMTINIEMAMITPPVGINLFVVSGVCNEPLGEVVNGVLPFLIAMAVTLVIIMMFPQLSLFLPSLMQF